MPMTFPSPLLQLTLAGVLTAAPTGATPSGLYTQIGGTPPSGIALGDIFSWSGSSAILYRTFSNAPSAITCAGNAYLKNATGYWVVPSTPVAVYGQITIPQQTTPGLNRTWADVSGGSITVPSAGVWLLSYSLTANSGQWWNSTISDASGNQVPGTQAQTTNSGSAQSVSAQAIVTTTESKLFKMRVFSYGGATVSIPNNNPAASENQAQSIFMYLKISS